MADIKGFERDLNKFAKSIGVKTEIAIKKIALQTFTGVVKKTPVDTGRARAGWVIGVEQPRNSPFILGEAKLSASEIGSRAAIEIASLSRITPFSTVFISNNLPYIEVLEEGSSKQAPEGMVAVTLTEVERDIKRIENEF